ncbi:enoyl-CoA hydratase/isomerase family protein [Legionella impletisoli]|uniref:3-hydroxyisobutyryl-CoA hydrolase n=1 Tax=Legionella impletisoli TaxID=343510 RepID=A0A917JNR8_9GAMM|nr:enoyl-CoA hydratase/isomerase family protein [Legionella impletisoli]GGI78647.1 3-hydroxyisobutyryl-CoA hydrolase [Legionella impletisoli]
MTEGVAFSRENHIGLITLNRPKALNALSLPMILAIQEQLLAWQEDSKIHAVVVRALPGKAFCAGGDVRWLYEAGQQDNPEQMDFFWHEYRLNHFIHHFKKPYIALMDGITMGGGVGISLHGSHPIASTAFTFAMPETGIGFFPDIGASHLLSLCPNQFGTYLALTGNRLNAADAFQLGLVRYVVETEAMKDLLDELIKLDLSQHASKQIESCLSRYTTTYASNMVSIQAKVKESFNYGEVEAIVSFLESKEDDWHQKTLTILQAKAPLSLKVTLRQIRKAMTMNLAECLKMDFNLVNHFMQGNDFYEGVRALLVDKDKEPNWQPKCLEAVTNEMVSTYFEPAEKPLSFEIT